MTTTETTDFALRVADILRPLGITRNMRAYRILRDALARIYEQEDRLEAVQKEVYEPLSEQYHSRIGRSCHSSAPSSSNFCWAFLATMRSSFFKKDSLPS